MKKQPKNIGKGERQTRSASKMGNKNALREIKPFPKNLTTKKLREMMNDQADYISHLQEGFLELEEELERRGLKI